MSEKIDVQEMSGCVCQSARQLARQLTLIYDSAMAPSGLTSVQFGVLARLYALGNKGQAGVSLGALAQRVGRHASTVTRDLQPLVKAGLVDAGGRCHGPPRPHRAHQGQGVGRCCRRRFRCGVKRRRGYAIRSVGARRRN